MGIPAAPLTPLSAEQRAMVEENLGLVGHMLKLYYPQLCFDPDAYQDGVIGLARATRDWDPDRGKFSTYATNWIRSEIGNGIGRLHGRNARRANRDRTEYVAPVSLDAERVGDTNPIEESLAADDDPSRDALAGATLSRAVAFLRGAVQDEIDEALADRIIARALDVEAETFRALVERLGCPHSTAMYRHRRLIGLLRDQLELVA